MKKALITGITGQDGSYLAEFLLQKGYEVHGIVRRVAVESDRERLSRVYALRGIHLHSGDITDYERMLELFDTIKPDECYHLAAQSFVAESFKDPHGTYQTNIRGTHNVLRALQLKTPHCRFYFAGSSEMFGEVEETPQTERTRFHPRSPYAITKVTGFDMTRLAREQQPSTFACSGILFNHESPRRGFEFVTRKITRGIADIKAGKTNVLVLGNLEAKRDWGFAGDYVQAMWLMLQQEKPDDYVIATGENHSVKAFVDIACSVAGIRYELVDLHTLSSEEANKKIEHLRSQQGVFVVQHPQFYRPAEVHTLLGDASKARHALGWKPLVTFSELARMMIEHDLAQ